MRKKLIKSGLVIWVAEKRIEEYLAAGYKPAADKPGDEPEIKIYEKLEDKPKRGRKAKG